MTLRMDFSTYLFYVIKMCWETLVCPILFFAVVCYLSCLLLKKPTENFLGVVSGLLIMQN